MPRALVVEDEVHIRDLVCLHLGLEGFECVGVGDGREAIARARAEPFDLLVLDLMIPGIDGLSVCRAVRREGPNRHVPILMLTARREEADKVIGLESGADDYVTKPFGIRELVARVHALMRRAGTAPHATAESAAAPGPPVEAPEAAARVIRVHGIEVDPARHRVRVERREVPLTAQEFDLLRLLASHPGIVFSREALLARIWGGGTHVTERSVDALVKRLRRKVEANPAEPRLILTVWGVGYKLADV